MRICFDPKGDAESFRRLCVDLAADPGVAGLMVLACDANGWTPEILDPLVRGVPKPVFGGVFPQVIFESRNFERGTVILGLPRRPEIAHLKGLSDASADFVGQLEPWAERWEAAADPAGTLIVLVDGLGRRIAALVAALFDTFGLEQTIIGGGAGSLPFQQKPCLITPEGLVADSALLVRLPLQAGVGVAHGWRTISAPMKVTEADRTVIRSLDWRPAYDAYRDLVESHSGRTFTDNNFFDIAKCYPLGINRLKGELVVRDLLHTASGHGLVCVGEVPQGSIVRLLTGTPDELIAAAARARQLALESLPASAPAGRTALFLDCISRVLFLGDRIGEEVAAAAGPEALVGAMTLGEIASSGREYLEFFNKTSVLGFLCHEN